MLSEEYEEVREEIANALVDAGKKKSLNPPRSRPNG
jgi:hypothetical protein